MAYAKAYRFANGTVISLSLSTEFEWTHPAHEGRFDEMDIDFLFAVQAIEPVGPTSLDILDAASACNNFTGFAQAIASDVSIAERFLQLLKELDA